MAEDELRDARAQTRAMSDQIQAAFFADADLPATLKDVAAIAANCVERLCERGVELDQAVSVVVGGIAGEIVRHYSR